MEDIVEKIIELQIDEIITFDFPIDEPFGLKVNYKGVCFDFVIRLSSKNKNLLCTSPGASARNHKTRTGKLITPPYVERWSWYKYFDCSFIAHADPMLYLDDKLTLGWCVGTKDHWYLKTIANIINFVAINQRIRKDNILFYGSSNGGFLSIVLATFLKGSSCLVNNCQFSLFDYLWEMNKQLFTVLDREFKGVNASENRIYVDGLYQNSNTYQRLNEFERDIVSHIYYRVDLIELFKKEKYVPNITYYLHVRSLHDVNDIAVPFFKKIINFPYFNDRLNVMMYHEKRDIAHTPLSYDKFNEIIRLYSKIKLNNPRENKYPIGFFDYENYKDEIIKEKFEIDYYKDDLGQLSKYKTARIDLKNFGISTNAIEIIENSDKNANVTNIDYFKDEFGIGTQIQSEEGFMHLKLKCINEGILDIRLRGIDFIGDFGRLPIYIKYTSFEINGKKLLDVPLTVWHDKPFFHRMDVKDGELVEVLIKWEPV